MDSVYLYNKYGAPISHDAWGTSARIVDWVCDHWHQADEGIWEVRGGRQHFVYSNLMCWVAVDRAIRLADKRSFPADRTHWLCRAGCDLRRDHARGWHPERQAFVQHFETDVLDASLLLMPLVKFIAPTDPRGSRRWTQSPASWSRLPRLPL